MTSRRRPTGGIRPDAWAKQLTAALAEETGEDTQARSEPLVLVVGGGWSGRRLAGRLAGTHQVHHLDTDPDVVADPETHEGSHTTDLAASTALTATGVTADDLAVVATGEDGRSLLVTQHLRTRFGLERILVVLEEPRNREAFDVPGVEVVCARQTVSEAVHSVLLETVGSGLGGERVTTSPTS